MVHLVDAAEEHERGTNRRRQTCSNADAEGEPKLGAGVGGHVCPLFAEGYLFCSVVPHAVCFCFSFSAPTPRPDRIHHQPTST